MHLIVEPYPFGKRFAVALIDDTDNATLKNVAPVYERLAACGIRTTKTVWPLKASSPSGYYPYIDTITDTLEDEDYRGFCQRLQTLGFEIAMHTASGGNSFRDETLKAYEFFAETFGQPPSTNIMHGRNVENLYWGKSCITNRLVSALIGLLEPQDFLGHEPSSEYYWGDICSARTKYVRMFETLTPNTLKFDPATPYHDPAKPKVPWWFSSTYGAGTRLFAVLSPNNLKKLA